MMQRDSQPERRGTRSLRRHAARRALALWLLTHLLVPPALAGPSGERVVSGQAQIERQGDHTESQVGHRSILEWQSFDIGQNESVQFLQPGSSSRVLNRIGNSDPTYIDGLLSANGQVYIANPYGVYFGGNAVVDVARLVAAAGSISNQDFLLGDDHFTDLQGRVENRGRIQAHDVQLLGARVANHGEIQAAGSLLLVSGREVWLAQHDSHLLIKLGSLIDGDAEPGEGAAIENSGRLEAGERARLVTGDALGISIRNTGLIRARQIALEGGRDSRLEISGRLDASNPDPGERGGEIEILGDWIALEGARLDASGGAGGGNVRVGGGLQGSGPHTARGTYVSEDSQVRADALSKGDGGQIVVWSDEITRVHGDLSARGGVEGGDGGFIETSSSGSFEVRRVADVSAPQGEAGVWLIDPANVEIRDTTDDPDLEDPDLTGPPVFQPLGDTSIISTAVLVEALAQGSNVVVTTNRFAREGSEVGNITVEDAIVVVKAGPGVSTASLTLQAANDILVKADIASHDEDLALSVQLFANENRLTSLLGQPELGESTTAIADNPQFERGNVILSGKEGELEIRTQGGSVELFGVDVRLNGRILTDGGRVDIIALNPRGVDDRVDPASVGGGTATIDARIETAGGGVSIQGVDLVDLLDATVIDAGEGVVAISSSGRVAVAGGVSLTAQTIDLLAGRSAGDEGALILSGAAVLQGDEISLRADDSEETGATMQTVAPIQIGSQVRFIDSGGDAAPRVLAFRQNADIDSAQLPTLDQFASAGVDDLSGTAYTLESREGTVEFLAAGGTALRVKGADLTLITQTAPVIEETIRPESVEVRVASGFEVEASLAEHLRPSSTLTLHGGTEGARELDSGEMDPGDLRVGDLVNVRLQADRIALRAGDGAGASQVIIGDGATFRTGDDSGAPEAFSIEQDANIEADDIPKLEHFGLDPEVDSLAGVEYGLRSNQGSVTLGHPERLNDTHLSVAARLGIQFAEGAEPIRVQSADLGGLASFQVGPEHVDGFEVVGDGSEGSKVRIFRAALGGTGVLSFAGADEGTLMVPADEVRLIASDGRPGSGTGSVDLDGSKVIFHATDAVDRAPAVFVLQQDAALVRPPDAPDSSSLLASQALFGGGNLPILQAYRSDEGAIELDASHDLADGLTGDLVLEADTISIARGEVAEGEGGADLDFPGLGGRVFLRGRSIKLEAGSNLDTGELGKVDASAGVRLSGFDRESESVDLGTLFAPTSPDSFSILQAATISSGQLPDRLHFGDPTFADGSDPIDYRLESTQGSIALEDGSPVQGSDLSLILGFGEDELETVAETTRRIDLGAGALDLSSLLASSEGPLELMAGADITASSVTLHSGTSITVSKADGSLDFGNDPENDFAGIGQLTLASPDITLAAEFDGASVDASSDKLRLREGLSS
ncbi:MAG: filamentous hemagglutinin N-terminal domain-containing protein, partial [Myxococcota bacterium]